MPISIIDNNDTESDLFSETKAIDFFEISDSISINISDYLLKISHNFSGNDSFFEKCDKNLNLIFFHGSPGKISDFDQLSSELTEFKTRSLCRKGYPDYNSSNYTLSEKEHLLIVGYSWGCREALEYYSKNTEMTEGIVLISPNLMNIPNHSMIYKNLFSKHYFTFFIKFIYSKLITFHKKNTIFDKLFNLPELLILLRSFLEKIDHQYISYASILRLSKVNATPIHCITFENDSNYSACHSLNMICKIAPDVKSHFFTARGKNVLDSNADDISEIIRSAVLRNRKTPSFSFSSHTNNQKNSFTRMRENKRCLWS